MVGALQLMLPDVPVSVEDSRGEEEWLSGANGGEGGGADTAPASAPPEELRRVMRAFEVLSDPDLRDRYDRSCRIRGQRDGTESAIPHITNSARPADRARAILYLLIEGRVDEVLRRLEQFDENEESFLSRYLDKEEMIDAAFLLGEVYERRKSYFKSLQWYQEVLRLEQHRRRHRPCYGEAVERTKKVLIHRLPRDLEPRATLEYLHRAEQLGLDRQEWVEVCKRRALCYAEMQMLGEAANHLRQALTLNPQLKGIQRLRQLLAEYLD